ncbi:DUF4402 domain-containing protein [Sphingomicrobium flavum]|uniref:DUF4402 domain-containing protein n=1 Tax=Sphingomicrobium flavum TaxID=1229164 RepID=UPI0021ADA0C0|nr:DUF4402 domain-containing protein [Sphingomicrobium flavum]
MTNLKKIAAVALAATALTATPAYAAPVSDNTGKARVTIVKPLSIAKAGDLDFGTVVLPATASGASTSLSIDATSGAVMTQDCATDGFTCSVANGAAASNITYTLTGSSVVEVNVDIPASVQLDRVGGGTTPVTVSLTTSLSNTDTDTSYDLFLSNSGTPGTDFYVGGDVTIGDGVEDGVYEGTFTVTADYQ